MPISAVLRLSRVLGRSRVGSRFRSGQHIFLKCEGNVITVSAARINNK